ncbi:hypothetical protein QBC35DRAFT_134560 [Podospora australis]|uniref:Uncharacterized protein n=1 Tax=Podospora australis TaxID=1536484 RepID=A0AAN7AIA4_9PEZI|nr:hypothetical protein QBC35DRAFT_134560 [Podospora australis]
MKKHHKPFVPQRKEKETHIEQCGFSKPSISPPASFLSDAVITDKTMLLVAGRDGVCVRVTESRWCWSLVISCRTCSIPAPPPCRSPSSNPTPRWLSSCTEDEEPWRTPTVGGRIQEASDNQFPVDLPFPTAGKEGGFVSEWRNKWALPRIFVWCSSALHKSSKHLTCEEASSSSLAPVYRSNIRNPPFDHGMPSSPRRLRHAAGTGEGKLLFNARTRP